MDEIYAIGKRCYTQFSRKVVTHTKYARKVYLVVKSKYQLADRLAAVRMSLIRIGDVRSIFVVAIVRWSMQCHALIKYMLMVWLHSSLTVALNIGQAIFFLFAASEPMSRRRKHTILAIRCNKPAVRTCYSHSTHFG